MRVKVYLAEESQLSSTAHVPRNWFIPVAVHPWAGWMNSPLGTHFWVILNLNWPSFSKQSNAEPTSAELKCSQEHSANPKRKSRLGGSHPKDVVRPVAQEMLETTYAKPYGQRKKNQNTRKAFCRLERRRLPTMADLLAAKDRIREATDSRDVILYNHAHARERLPRSQSGGDYVSRTPGQVQPVEAKRGAASKV